MQLIATVTVGAGGAASMELPGIPATFDDLALVVSARVTNVGIYEQDLAITFNGNTSNRISRRLFGNATSNGLSQSRTDLLIGQVVSALNSTPSFSKTSVYIPNYRLATAKSYSSDSGQVAFASADGNWANLIAGTWSDNAAISSIQIFPSSGTFVQGTTASLYGIRSARSFAKATGGTIYYDATNNKVVHVFTASGAFTPTQSLSCDILLVAGGGAGSGTDAGGGGAGGVVYFASQSVAASSFTVTVGAGGTGGAAYSDGTSGSNSSFGALQAANGGGRGGGAVSSKPGAAGGSGGGGSAGSPALGGGPGTGGSSNQTGTGATAFHGNAGGNGFFDEVTRPGGGGGGAGGAGVAGANGVAGNGGAAITTYSSFAGSLSLGVSGAFAGGGGGGLNSGTPGAGGGGGAGNGNVGTTGANGFAALPNTGSGGGGGANDSAGGNGGSGFVVVRYDA